MKYKIKNLILSATAVLTISAYFVPVTFASDINQDNLTTIINAKREENGLSPLKINYELNQAATLKSKDMLNRHYFDHYAFGLAPWDFMKMSGYDYLYAGENLAMDFNTSEGMVNAWLDSPTHRENILNPDYTELGLGIVKGVYVENGQSHDTIMVTNMFGRKKPGIIKIFDLLSKNFSDLFWFNR